MSSSISSSDPGAIARWRRFFALTVGSAAVIAMALYGFIVIIDPWDTLPLSPPLPRVPISSDARYSFPALARSTDYDSAIFGTSTSRLLRPALLEELLGGHFMNLAMNAAAVPEQSALMGIFLRSHPAPRIVMLGIDAPWCLTDSLYARFKSRPVPEWMQGNRNWSAYRHVFDLYALQEAANQFAVMVGLKRARYGLDGYTMFTPPDDTYDAARAHAHILKMGTPDYLGDVSVPTAQQHFPAHAILADFLRALPAGTRKVLFFVPIVLVHPNGPGSPTNVLWQECKRRITRIAAATPETVVVDFMIPSWITRNETNYWDGLHYRSGIADTIVRDIALALRGEPSPNGEDHILWNGTRVASSPAP